MNWAYNLLVSLDQLFNSIAGGNPDVTISSHCATMDYNYGGGWSRLRKLIDATFAPIEKSHCYNSMIADDDRDITQNLTSVTLIAIAGCVLLYIPIRLIALVSKVTE